MKKVVSVLLVLITVVVLSACGKKTADNEITFGWWGTSDRNVATYRAIELFEEKYPQYKVKGEQSTWNGYQQALNNKLNRGTEADVFQVNYNWIYSMYGKDYFMDITELGIDLSKYPTDEHKPLTVDGKVLGLSVSETGYIFYLNQKVYEDAGVSFEGDRIIPETWEELMVAGETIQAHNSSHYALGRLDAQQVAILMFSYLAQKTGKNVINENNQLNFTQAELVDGFNFISDLRSTGVLIPSNAIDTHIDGPTNPNWTQQKYGGILQWNTAISEYQNTLPSDANLVMAGMFQQASGESLGMYKKVSMAYAVSKRVEGSKEKQEAVKTFIEFMTTDPEAVAILGVDRGVSSNTDTQTALKAVSDADYSNSLEWKGHEVVQSMYNHQLEESINLYIHPYYEHNTFRAIYEGPIESFLLNNINATEAASRIISKFNAELKRIMED
ncbi:oligogalacturonide transport system substrate-binding protein [Acholeplasma morum]|uniref:ABC transporter substrate-binding protein n=1 Tax=Paracholeplasma morum TaxID=264637 RepID=UPI0019590FE7|nr:ABC transporter substrate-binding protein [Paracholeplasma morum]MBM7453858.1 oligogalacturonide transport system substrate-binding protein [Paracholeplasma morum]